MSIRDTYRSMAQRVRKRSQRGSGDLVNQETGMDSGHAIAELFDRLVAEAVERGADSALIATALHQATQAAADLLTQRLQAGAPRMLREHRDFRRGFEQRLQQRWGPALELYECVRVCCLETGEDFQKRQDQQADEGSVKRSALTLLHARACLVASEVQGLLRSGHAAGAQARWRTLHELAVVAFVLSNHDPEISERFLLHRHVERYKDARQYQQYARPWATSSSAIRKWRRFVSTEMRSWPDTERRISTLGAGQHHCCQLASEPTSDR